MKPRIFVSYAHDDTKWLNLLDPHLAGLRRHAQVEGFDDRGLLGGEEWDRRIKVELAQADIFLALVTANFVGSDYINDTELPIAKDRRSKGECVIVPILVDHCHRKFLGLDDANYLPKDDSGKLTPISQWPEHQRSAALTQVIDHLDRQIEAIAAARREGARTHDNQPAGINLPLYRQRAQAKWSAIDLADLALAGAADRETPIRLAEVFIPPQLRRSRPPTPLPRDWLARQGLDPEHEAREAARLATSWESLSPEPALDLIAQPDQRRLVLLGDPGAGKSALTRFVLLQLLAEAPQAGSPLAALHGHLPLLIELRDFVVTQDRHRATDLLSYLGYLGETLNFGFTADAIRQHLTHAPVLLIIDGLDEIFDHHDRDQMVQQIVGLALRYPNLRLLLTARIAGFTEQALRDAGFSIATLTDLSPDQVTAFAQQWFSVTLPLDPAAAEQGRDRLLAAVRGRPQLRVLAGNPMLLTIMASMARSQSLARSRTALYAQVLDLLCFHWDDNRRLAPPADSLLRDLGKDDALLMLRRIAWRMQESREGLRANAMDEADLLRVLEQFFRDDWHFDAPKAARAAREMEQRLEDRNWVVTRRGPALYGFVHRTFLEYLCALEIIERFKAQRIDADRLIAEHVVPRLDDDTWHEVLRLLVGLLPDEATEAIGRVIAAILPGEADVSAQGVRLGLAWQALAELKPQIVPNLAAVCGDLTDRLYQWLRRPGHGAGVDIYQEQLRICRAAAGMIAEAADGLGTIAWPAQHPPARAWPALVERDFGPASFIFLEPTTQLVAGLGKTIWGCAAATGDWLRARAVDDPDADARGAALAALVEHFRDEPRTAELLRARAVDYSHASARGAALAALAEHFRDEPRTAELLRARAVDDPDAYARGAALAALAQHFRDEPRTAELLRARAVDDPHADARRAALAALAQHFRDEPRTAELLRARAVDDPDADARGAALNALAQHFRDEPRTAELLRARAVDDPDAFARSAALAALAQHFRDEPRTAGLLRARAVDDPHASARRDALAALAQHFRDEPRTADLLRARAVDDPDAYARGAARAALAQHFRDEPRTAELLRARAVDDPDADARGAALLALARTLAIDSAAVLCSRDLDGGYPGWDAREPITRARVAQAAAKLGRPEAAVRELYEQLARVAPLTLVWQQPKRGRARRSSQADSP